MRNSQILDITHNLIKTYITQDDIVIDMTMGNGYDTLFLSRLAKFVYSFDIQDKAIEHTQTLLNQHGVTNVKCIHDSHENIANYVNQFKYAVYNLGYLPTGDKHITTKKESTIHSLDIVLNHIADEGIIFMVVYPGHEQGYEESTALEDYLKKLNKIKYKTIKTYLPYQDNKPPYLITIYKQKRT